MANEPPWLGVLRSNEQLNQTLTWLSPEESARLRESWRATWNQIPYDEVFHERSAARLARCVPLAHGPVRHRRLGKQASSMVLVHDPAEPDTAWLSLSGTIPAAAWAPAGSTPTEVEQRLAFYTPATDTPVGELPRQERLVKVLDIEDFGPIQGMIDKVELWIDDASWGSAYDEDPWSTLDPSAGMLDLSLLMRRVQSQGTNRRPSLSYRTLWSRSVITIEQHPFGLWVFDVRYQPASDHRAIAALSGNEPGSRLPPDLPVDVAASLMRGGSLTRESLRANELLSWGPTELAALCAAEPGEAHTVRKLREAAENWKSENQARDLISILDLYGYTSLLFEVASQTTDSALLADIESMLAPVASQEDAS